MYNPDGKEIIARDNEISLLRKKMFPKHISDATPISQSRIPSWGISRQSARDGRKLPLIQNGRFVVAGTEKLNEELDG